MKYLFVGGRCIGNCFAAFGRCDVHKELRDEELSSDQVALRLGMLHGQGERIFLYTPDMFSDFYYESIFLNLPLVKYMHDDKIYIAINASVRTYIDRAITPNNLLERGIREIWLGVESASDRIRNLYDKPKFTNAEVLEITEKCKESGIEVCWYLIDGPKDTIGSKLATYDLIVRGRPNRVRFARLTEES